MVKQSKIHSIMWMDVDEFGEYNDSVSYKVICFKF